MTTDATAGWPTPLSLPGQAAAPEGPVDVNTMYILHHGFRRDLGSFVAAVDGTPLEDRATWQALSDRWDVFAVELHRHHKHEDATLWPILLSRVDDEGRAVLTDMHDEHASIDPILAECAAGFTTVAAEPTEEGRAALLAHLRSGRENLDGHLAHEERAAIPLIQEHCGQADWTAFEKAAQKESGLSGLLRIVPWAAYGLDPQLRDDLFRSGPALMRVVWRLTHTRFERQERRAFRYV